ncbi:hypothetical protein Zmor_005365 [Zophobas morio]|uniref:Uncharacterized protein n=1 Tax=Zophobas morio TaxID=2755281 RepID=A0AA38MLV1_9CUCU|nr:hypothetical protein Zmor_005365 [Zophobas morio]
MNRTTRIKNQKNVQKQGKGQSRTSCLPSYIRLTSLTMVNFSNSERFDMVMLYGVADGHPRRLSQSGDSMCANIYIVAVIGTKEHCKLIWMEIHTLLQKYDFNDGFP